MRQVPVLRYSRRLLLGSIGTGVCYGAFAANSIVRFDSRQKSPPAPSQPAAQASDPLLSSRIIRQISAGSIVGQSAEWPLNYPLLSKNGQLIRPPLGFGTGLVVSVFSRTLVFIGGVLAAFYHVSAYATVTSYARSPLTCLVQSSSPPRMG